jgi:hypothetical protein
MGGSCGCCCYCLLLRLEHDSKTFFQGLTMVKMICFVVIVVDGIKETMP